MCESCILRVPRAQVKRNVPTDSWSYLKHANYVLSASDATKTSKTWVIASSVKLL